MHISLLKHTHLKQLKIQCVVWTNAQHCDLIGKLADRHYDHIMTGGEHYGFSDGRFRK